MPSDIPISHYSSTDNNVEPAPLWGHKSEHYSEFHEMPGAWVIGVCWVEAEPGPIGSRSVIEVRFLAKENRVWVFSDGNDWGVGRFDLDNIPWVLV